MNNQKLYRSQTNKVFAGVCGGLAEYFDVDPVVIRIIFVLMLLFGGSGFLLYLVAIFIVPKRPFAAQPFVADQSIPVTQPKKDTVRNWFGGALVVFGFIILLSNLEIFHFFNFLEDAFEYVFPVLLIILGMAIIYYRQSQQENPPQQSQGDQSAPAAEYTTQAESFRQFRRSSGDKKLFGVCGGMAQYFGIDSSLLRMLYVVLCLASFGAGFVLYILIAIVVPYDNVMNARVS
ncbi:MAG: PspC domain-containing protein [Bacteroidota bacterium]